MCHLGGVLEALLQMFRGQVFNTGRETREGKGRKGGKKEGGREGRAASGTCMVTPVTEIPNAHIL